MDLQTWVGRYIRHTEDQRPGFTVRNDLWNDLWNLVIMQGDYNTETLNELITQFLVEKQRTSTMLTPSNIKGGANVSVKVDATTNDVIISATGGGGSGGSPTVDEINELIKNAIIQYDVTVIDAMQEDLQEQIDGKINTYYQEEDPAIYWDTSALQTQHTGDLWYNTSLQKSYRWSGSAWLMLVDKDAEDAKVLAQNKAQVFTTEPTTPYKVGDLWTNELGLLLYCTTSRSTGPYDSADWAVAYSSLVDDLDDLSTRVTKTESDIIQSNADIALRVTQEQYSTDQASTLNRLSSAEEKLTPESIMSTVSSSTEYQQLIASDAANASGLTDVRAIALQNSTAIEQTSSQIEFKFNNTVMQIGDLADIVDYNQAVIEEYIRFAGALIQLGRVGNDFTAELDNTKLSFKQNGVEIAYISNHKMYITDAEVKNKFTIGREGKGFFDWILKDNGNLTLKWRNA